MEQQEWIDGVFEETDTDYTIAGMNVPEMHIRSQLVFYRRWVMLKLININ